MTRSSDTSGWPFPRAEALPTYAFVATDALKAKVVASGADLIDLGLGNPDRPTPEPIVEQLHQAANIGKNHRYHPGRGLVALRQAIADWYKRRYSAAFDIDQEVIVTMGAKEGISHLCFAILSEGDYVVAPDPCYPIHEGAPAIAGATVVGYASGPGNDPAESVARALKEVSDRGGKTKLVIANYPQNPTGVVVTKEQLGRLVRVVQESGALLLHDLAYADLDFSTPYATSIFDCGIPVDEVKEFAVEVFSMSKSYHMPGWRIAFMLGQPRMIRSLAHLKTYLDYGTFIPLQQAAAWALENGDHLVEEMRELYRARATALVEGLRAAGWTNVSEPSGTMFVWAPLPEVWANLTSAEVAQRLLERAHVAVSPGTGFGKGGEGYVRFALIEDPPRIKEACERIARALKE